MTLTYIFAAHHFEMMSFILTKNLTIKDFLYLGEINADKNKCELAFKAGNNKHKMLPLALIRQVKF